MVDPEAVVEELLKLATTRMAVVFGAHEDVGRESCETARDRPDVEVVDALDPGDGEDGLGNVVRAETARGALHEDRRRLAEHAPGAPQDQRREHEARDRVRGLEPGGEYHESGNDHEQRPERVPAEVDE